MTNLSRYIQKLSSPAIPSNCFPFPRVPVFSSNLLAISHYVVLKSTNWNQLRHVLISFKVFQSREYRKKFQISYFDLRQILLWVRECPNDDGKELGDVICPKSEKNKIV